MACEAKIRPFPDDTEISCDVEDQHTHHRGVIRDYAYPGSRTVLSWHDSDRRSFTGKYRACPVPDCVLPYGHRGDEHPR